MVFSTDDTIAAIATAEGRGGIGVVRLSGPRATAIAAALLDRKTPLAPRHATLAHVVRRGSGLESGHPRGDPSADARIQDLTPRIIDQVVATWFAAPESYTGEDVVEISGHGSPVVLREMVALAVEAGARQAEPGEFTLRAYLNGRLDLVQAEAVADLVEAVTPAQARAAMDQLEGTLTERIGGIERRLFELVARLEASLDFPEEGFHFITREEANDEIGAIEALLAALSREGRHGRLIREGRTVVIAGPPNAGKSSLFNIMVGADRAIVTAVPGTTRDVITERIDLGGLSVTLVDTAGLRDTRDVIEAEGIARAKKARDVAALTVVVLDGAASIGPVERAVLADVAEPRLVVVSKTDLGRAWPDEALGLGRERPFEVSATSGEGVAALREGIRVALGLDPQYRECPALTNARHLALVDDARDAIQSAGERLAEGATEEVVLTEIARAREALESVTGRRSADDLLHHIFSRFCIGK